MARGAQRGALARPAAAASRWHAAAQHRVDRSSVGKAGHQVDEVLPLEADGAVAIPGREAHAGELRLQPRARPCAQVPLGLDVAAGGDVDLRHGRYRVNAGRRPPAVRSARVRSMLTPTSRELRIAPGLLMEMRTHSSPNSSSSSMARRCARVSTSLNSRRLDAGQHALGDLLVVHRVGDLVADRGAAAVDGQLEVDHDRLLARAAPSR